MPTTSVRIARVDREVRAGNDLELAWDRPFDEWWRYGSDDAPPNDGRLDLDELLSSRR